MQLGPDLLKGCQETKQGFSGDVLMEATGAVLSQGCVNKDVWALSWQNQGHRAGQAGV